MNTLTQNKIKLTAYSSGTTAVKNSGLDKAEGLTFSTVYPGGLYENLSCFIPADITRQWPVRLGYRIAARNGSTIVWEGYITRIARVIDSGRSGFKLEAAGAWSYYLMRRQWRKPWADTRIDQNTWVSADQTTAVIKPDKFTEDRRNRLHIVQKAVSIATNELYAIDYITPTTQTIKRITFNYDFANPAQTWTFRLRDNTNTTTLWSVTTTGTGSQDITLGTASSSIAFQLVSGANQTGISDGTYYADATDITVYTETGAINLTEIAKDIRAHVTELSADTDRIDSNTLSLVPFVSEGESIAEALTRAASYGDSSNNSWAAYVDNSSFTSDNKPVLTVEQQPALTSTDYRIKLGEALIRDSIETEETLDDVRNWITVKYKGLESGYLFVTPDDDSDLTDATSVATYGELHETLSLDTTSLTLATEYGKRYLAKYKDPQKTVSNGISVNGIIRTNHQGYKPVCEVRAGERVKIEDISTAAGEAAPVYLITRTEYDDDSQTIRLSVGKPDTFGTWLERTLRQIKEN